MAGTTVVVKRQWPLFTSHTVIVMPFEQAVYEAIIDIITDLETIRASMTGTDVLLDADSGVTDTDYVSSTSGQTYNVAGDLVAPSLSTPELGD